MPKATAKIASKTRIQRWWLTGGDEECPHCGQLYAVELEFRCPDCDGPSCLHCAVLHEDRSVCPGCVGAGSAGAKEGR